MNETEEKTEKQFSLFFRSYCAYHYRALGLNLKAVMAGIFGRQDAEGWNQWLVYDHGLFWRVLRDLYVLFATAIRLTQGVVVVTVGPPLLLLLALLRALYIPLRGLMLACKQEFSLWRVQRARAKSSE